MSDFQPELFGKYYLVDKVATGGMAEVFKAKTYSTAGFEKLQVIKRILSHLGDNEEFVSMFIDEAKISVSLQHANLVQIYDFGKIRENYFIAMEWVDGKDVKMVLRKLAEKRRFMPEEFAVFIAHEACKGLDYAHRKTNLQGDPLNIIHRDMSPSNVLIAYSGEIKIADFGIAKAEVSTYTTKDGVLKGKFEYMSPEQCRGESVTQQSDLFAVGIMLYEMLTGRRLFKTDSEIKTLEKIKNVAVPPPSHVNPNIDKRLDAIVMKALTQHAEDRYPDAREFQQALLEHMYPSTPTVIQRSLSMFMEQLFEQELVDERARLEAGSRLAEALREQRDAEQAAAAANEWEEGPGSGTSMRTEPEPRSKVPVIVGLLVIAVLGSGLVWQTFFRTPETEIVQVDATPTTGRVVLRIQPDTAKVFIGEELMGEGASVTLDALEPGQVVIRVEAEGHEPFEETLSITAAERLVLPVNLKVIEEVKGPAPQRPPDTTPQQPAAAKGPAGLRFESTPAGAQVRVNGEKVGTTPITWEGATTRTRYQIRYTLSGHEDSVFTATAPKGEGEVGTVTKSLKAKTVAMGKASISLAASNRWADVYVDGKKAGTTPLFNHALSVGVHKVRVVNEGIGLDKTSSVTVSAGETARLIFDLD